MLDGKRCGKSLGQNPFLRAGSLKWKCSLEPLPLAGRGPRSETDGVESAFLTPYQAAQQVFLESRCADSCPKDQALFYEGKALGEDIALPRYPA